MDIDWLKYVKEVTVSTQKPIKGNRVKKVITLSSWQRRSYDKNTLEHSIIDYSTKFSAN